MSGEALKQKLDSLARCLRRLESKVPASAKALAADIDLQDIVMINLERLVQLSVDAAAILISDRAIEPMPTSMAGVFDVLAQHKLVSTALAERMKKSVGFRNLAVHEYDKVNWDIVQAILTKHLADFRELGRVLNALAT